MGDIIKLAVVLFIVSSVAGLAIAYTNKQTSGRIALQNKMAEEQALNVVFPDSITITKHGPTDQLPESYWVGKKNNTIVGYAFKGSNKGYSSDIKFIVGIDPEGTILGLTILSQVETPGLGDRIQEVVSKDYIWNGLFKKKQPGTPWFTKQFKGINVTKGITVNKTSEWHTIATDRKKSLLDQNMITAITGATISTKAVSSGIKEYAYTYLSALKTTPKNNDTTENQPDHSEQE